MRPEYYNVLHVNEHRSVVQHNFESNIWLFENIVHLNPTYKFMI